MRPILEIVFAFVALSVLMTILQTPDLLRNFNSIPLFKIFILISFPIILGWMVWSVREYMHRRGVWYYCVQKFRALSIPRVVKIIIVVVVAGNFMAIAFGAQRYPFYDVGMYRWPKEYSKRNKIAYEVKYYYRQANEIKILELRKESSFLLSEHFGWGYANDIAYASAYFHKGEKENFDYISREMKERGVDTLWAGVHAINFETNEVTFDPDICNAIRVNQSGELYYGALYIPEYQMEKCNGN